MADSLPAYLRSKETVSHQTAHNVESKPRTEDIHITEDVDFAAMMLSENVLTGLHESGFKKPSPIQLKAIPLGRCGFDLVMQAKAGTGKTCVFTILALEMVLCDVSSLQVLILAPTREIAVQITHVITDIGRAMPGLKVETFIGGLSFDSDVRKAEGCQIAVGAPGRVKHLIESKHLDVSRVRLFVLDEADKLMEGSFLPDINYIFSQLPVSKQVVASSATYPDELDNTISFYMRSPMRVSPSANRPVLLGVRQYVKLVRFHPNSLAQMRIKMEKLVAILSSVPFTQCIVFFNYQGRSEVVCTHLNNWSWPAICITGNQPQQTRLAAMKKMRDFHSRVLLATDLIARGIDLENVNLVVNFDVAVNSTTYLHRIGRAGRYGSHGLAISLVSSGIEMAKFQRVLGFVGGEKMSVAKLPKTSELKNLWHCDYSALEPVYGVVGDKPQKSELQLSNGKSHENQQKSVISNEENCSAQNDSNCNQLNGDYIAVNGDTCERHIEIAKCNESCDSVKVINPGDRSMNPGEVDNSPEPTPDHSHEVCSDVNGNSFSEQDDIECNKDLETVSVVSGDSFHSRASGHYENSPCEDSNPKTNENFVLVCSSGETETGITSAVGDLVTEQKEIVCSSKIMATDKTNGITLRENDSIVSGSASPNEVNTGVEMIDVQRDQVSNGSICSESAVKEDRTLIEDVPGNKWDVLSSSVPSDWTDVAKAAPREVLSILEATTCSGQLQCDSYKDLLDSQTNFEVDLVPDTGRIFTQYTIRRHTDKVRKISGKVVKCLASEREVKSSVLPELTAKHSDRCHSLDKQGATDSGTTRTEKKIVECSSESVPVQTFSMKSADKSISFSDDDSFIVKCEEWSDSTVSDFDASYKDVSRVARDIDETAGELSKLLCNLSESDEEDDVSKSERWRNRVGDKRVLQCSSQGLGGAGSSSRYDSGCDQYSDTHQDSDGGEEAECAGHNVSRVNNRYLQYLEWRQRLLQMRYFVQRAAYMRYMYSTSD